MGELAASGGQLLSPRGLTAPFSGYDDCGPYPFEKRQNAEHDDGPLAHDLYIWNGRSALALTKAVTLTKCFELERSLLGDEAGTIRHLHRGAGRQLVAASQSFRADYLGRSSALSADSDLNHLFSLLCKHEHDESIPCTSLLSCSLPGLSSLSSSSFPELQKALFAHLKPHELN